MDINYLSSTGLVTDLSPDIVESGNNYIRFSNGIQMCFGNCACNNIIDQILSFKNGSYYNIKHAITYPKPFDTTGSIAPFTIAIRSNAGVNDKPTIDNCINIIGTSSDATSMGLRLYEFADRDYSTDNVVSFEMSYLAIGRWK